MNGGVGVAGGNHDLILAVDGVEPFYIHLEQAVAVGDELDLALLHRRGVHVLVLAQDPQPLGRLVLVEHAALLFPHVQVLLAHGEQHGDILFRHHVSLAEPGVLGDAGDDLGQIMAEHVANGPPGVDELHIVFLPNKKEVPSFTVPPGKRVEYPPFFHEAPFQRRKAGPFPAGPWRSAIGRALRRYRSEHIQL